MEQNNNNVEDFSLNVFSVTPCRPNRSDAQVSDGDKAGTTLLFSGSPHFCPAYPLDNLAFTGDENFTTYPAENTRNHRSEDSSDETEELGEDYTCNNLSPPRYEEIYPLSS
ncbi:transmembrane protein 174 isoform X2 [Pithys albifrons albifrons]|uniref:transmembrane protein 174 isoform X2 n=1 Tax=Pithys albifrons albifrons TaxID=3385563 RepID=UPI003A5CDDFC